MFKSFFTRSHMLITVQYSFLPKKGTKELKRWIWFNPSKCHFSRTQSSFCMELSHKGSNELWKCGFDWNYSECFCSRMTGQICPCEIEDMFERNLLINNFFEYLACSLGVVVLEFSAFHDLHGCFVVSNTAWNLTLWHWKIMMILVGIIYLSTTI